MFFLNLICEVANLTNVNETCFPIEEMIERYFVIFLDFPESSPIIPGATWHQCHFYMMSVVQRHAEDAVYYFADGAVATENQKIDTPKLRVMLRYFYRMTGVFGFLENKCDFTFFEFGRNVATLLQKLTFSGSWIGDDEP